MRLLHCARAAAQCIVIGPVCLWVCVCVCGVGWVCYHDDSKLLASILTKLGLQVKVVTVSRIVDDCTRSTTLWTLDISLWDVELCPWCMLELTPSEWNWTKPIGHWAPWLRYIHDSTGLPSHDHCDLPKNFDFLHQSMASLWPLITSALATYKNLFCAFHDLTKLSWPDWRISHRISSQPPPPSAWYCCTWRSGLYWLIFEIWNNRQLTPNHDSSNFIDRT